MSRRRPQPPRAPQPAAWLHALARPHNVEPTPFLPRSVARIRAATFDRDSIKTPPQPFRSKRRRK